MQAIETAIRKYREGDWSLFEASNNVGMHPQEFVHYMVEMNQLKACC